MAKRYTRTTTIGPVQKKSNEIWEDIIATTRNRPCITIKPPDKKAPWTKFHTNESSSYDTVI